jgi:hypothetical protein
VTTYLDQPFSKNVTFLPTRSYGSFSPALMMTPEASIPKVDPDLAHK